MKILKVFALFVVLHVAAWAVAHVWMKKNPNRVLVVVDTSFAMKPHAVGIKQWVTEFESQQRYTIIDIGTDKAVIGELSTLKSLEPLARTFFGKFDSDSLIKYQNSEASSRILLSDGSVRPAGWQVVEFN